MNKKYFFVLFLGAFFLFTACTNKVIVFDESLPDTETATIYWDGGDVRPVSFNGINVDWETGRGTATIKIPAGNTIFEVAGKTGNRNTTYFGFNGIYFVNNPVEFNWEGFSFSYKFEKGKEYTVYVVTKRISIHTGKSSSEEDLIATFSPDWK